MFREKKTNNNNNNNNMHEDLAQAKMKTKAECNCICYMIKITVNSFILIKTTYLLGVHCLVSLLNARFIFIRFRSNWNSKTACGINKSCNKIKCYTIFEQAIWLLSSCNIPKCATELIGDRNLDGETFNRSTEQ